jgi:hypothetical protein
MVQAGLIVFLLVHGNFMLVRAGLSWFSDFFHWFIFLFDGSCRSNSQIAQ